MQNVLCLVGMVFLNPKTLVLTCHFNISRMTTSPLSLSLSPSLSICLTDRLANSVSELVTGWLICWYHSMTRHPLTPPPIGCDYYCTEDKKRVQKCSTEPVPEIFCNAVCLKAYQTNTKLCMISINSWDPQSILHARASDFGLIMCNIKFKLHIYKTFILSYFNSFMIFRSAL